LVSPVSIGSTPPKLANIGITENRDNVDPEYVGAPKRWDAKSIARFMIWMGPMSSVFDIWTFLLNWCVAGGLNLILLSFVHHTRYSDPSKGIDMVSGPQTPLMFHVPRQLGSSKGLQRR